MRSDPFDWRLAPAPSGVMAALNEAGEARFVGGCVRDSLRDHPPLTPGGTDIDVATTLLPDEVIAVCARHGIRTVPTGVDHGTITAIVDSVPIEVTTLRADVSTDGRRATVAFTDDWARDAARRDFTMNALYLSADGSLFDHVGGRADIAAGRVRFIGEPSARIAEDYLRILRFLRFSARFAQTLDALGMRASIAASESLATLSKERIWQEMRKFFSAPRAPEVFAAAAAGGIWQHVVEAPADAALFARLHAATGGRLSPSLGIAGAWPKVTAPAFTSAFKPSNAELRDWRAIRKVAASGNTSVRELLYRFGRTATVEGLIYADADARRIEEAGAADIPVLPFKGGDFVALGLPVGPLVGRAVAAAETRWLAASFPTSPAELDRIKRASMQAAQDEDGAPA